MSQIEQTEQTEQSAQTEQSPQNDDALIDAVAGDEPPLDLSQDDPSDQATDEATAPAADHAATHVDTRQRILDAALDLFIEQGFDGTSLRQIAEQLGVTKAALYYHFESKDDILLALHMQLHEFGREALLRMATQTVTLEMWGELVDEMVDQMLAQRKIFLMHERNQAALEKLHNEQHEAEHEDIQNQFRRVLADTRIPIEDRVRMSASFGVLFSSLFLSGDAFSSTTNEELGSLLRRILHDVLFG